MKDSFLDTNIRLFRYYKGLAESAIAQVSDENMHWRINEDQNSIVIVMKHLAGNMLSRWTDFLTSDGEKTWRNRDSEFEDTFTDRQALMDYWEQGWTCLFQALEVAKSHSPDEIIYIRNEGQTVMEAILRQLAHYCNHIGQIIFISKMVANDWKSLSIPKNKSAEFNARLFASDKKEADFTKTAQSFSSEKEDNNNQ